MCHCVQTVRNILRGRGKFDVYEEIISLQFTVHDTSHHIYKQCLRKLQKRRGPGRHFGESQPTKLKSLFSRNKQRSKNFKGRDHGYAHARRLCLQNKFSWRFRRASCPSGNRTFSTTTTTTTNFIEN